MLLERWPPGYKVAECPLQVALNCLTIQGIEDAMPSSVASFFVRLSLDHQIPNNDVESYY